MRDGGVADAGLPGLPRQHRNHRPVRAEQQLGVGLGRHRCRPTRRSSRTTACRPTSAACTRPGQRPDRGRVAALSHRPRRPQLFRHARDLLLRLLRSRRAKPDSDHPSGGRLQQRVRPAGVRRRAQLSSQPHQPEPRQRRLRSDHPDRIHQRHSARSTTADPAAKTPANCLLRGIPGTYTRVSAEAHWRRTHHRSLRADLDAVRQAARRRRGAFDQQRARRYQLHRRPATHRVAAPCRRSASNTAIRSSACSPGARRPSSRSRRSSCGRTRPQIGKLPNEDAQSLIFDDSNLFRVDKFSGWDRVEGGGRANVGVQYTAQFNRGGFVNVLFGQSYQLFGANSFAVGDTTNTGLDSGLDTSRSDYVARVCLSAGPHLHRSPRASASTRTTFEVRRFEVEGRANFDRWSVCRALRQLRRPAADRLPDAARGHSRQRHRSSSTQNWRRHWPRSATTSTPTQFDRTPRSASATSTIASFSP